MIDHYNAFISYKHAPEDTRVAEAVQRGLEHFHIPAKIKSSTGMKKIDRIFRDKDELPITSDLSETIANALAHSDYLIVICSTNTKESAWVPREIEYFLRFHTKKDIFTVLVNGEPQDVIPEMLLYEDRYVLDQNGMQQRVRIPIEPLSCDFRMPLKKAEKVELPRLACGLIGCSYDELMNRRRQYRMRRVMLATAAAFSVSLAFISYLLYSRHEINKNYLSSLRNQSKYLANESENLLNDEQRITALQLVLEALPKDENDPRPITPEAISALTEGTLAYETNDGVNIHATWNYIMPNYIEDFKVSSDSSTITIRDAENVLGIWSTRTHEQILYLDKIGEKINGMEYLSEKSLVFWTDNKIICYDTISGKMLWEYTLKEGAFLLQENLTASDSSLFIATEDLRFIEIDSSTGEAKNEYHLDKKDIQEDFLLSEAKLSPDGTRIAFRGNVGVFEYVYGVMDIDTGDVRISDPIEEFVRHIEWIDDTNLMVSHIYVDFNGSMSIGDLDILSEDHSTILCVDPATLEDRWTADFACTGVTLNGGFFNLAKTGSVVYYSGNVATTYDLATGETLYVHNVNSSIIDVSDRDGDGNPLYITEHGDYTYPALNVSDRSVYSKKYFAEDLRQVVVNEGVYVRQFLGYEVIYYGVGVYDDNWKPLSDDIAITSYSTDYYMGEDTLAVLTEEDDIPVLSLFGLGDNKKSSQVKLSKDDSFSQYSILGIKDNKVQVGHLESSRYELITVDISTGDMETEEISNSYASLISSGVDDSGKMVYVFKDDHLKYKLGLYDLETKKTNSIALPEDAGYPTKAPLYFKDSNSVYFFGAKEYIIDVKEGTSEEVDVPSQWIGTDCISENSNGELIALSDGKRIILLDKEGKVIVKIDCPGIAPVGMSFTPNGKELLVVYGDGGLYWYSVEGIFKKKSRASVYYNSTGKVHFDYDTDNGIIYIQMSMLTDMIDMDSGVEFTHIVNCYGHHDKTDTFITQSYDTKKTVKVGYYPHYTVDELIDMAQEITDGTKLSDELKSQYGIED